MGDPVVGEGRSQPPWDDAGRYPSGAWTGFFLDSEQSHVEWLDLDLTFDDGKLHGAGRDPSGAFEVVGSYDPRLNVCTWTKRYSPSHEVTCKGYNEGKGIWGVWQQSSQRGGFHIWPVGMDNPTSQRREAQTSA